MKLRKLCAARSEFTQIMGLGCPWHRGTRHPSSRDRQPLYGQSLACVP